MPVPDTTKEVHVKEAILPDRSLIKSLNHEDDYTVYHCVSVENCHCGPLLS